MGCSASTFDTATTPRGNRKQTTGKDRHLRVTKNNRDSGVSTRPEENTSECRMDPGMFITQHQISLWDKYTREKLIGTGAYGEVLLCRQKESGIERAVKVIRKTDMHPNVGNSILEEVTVVKQLDHPNIMKLYEFFEDKKCFYLVMDLYTGGELFDEIVNRQRFTEADAADVIKQVLSGVTYLHKNRIVHRDLKPENLLLETKNKDALIKIVDFGLSSYFDPAKKMKDRLGTAYYIAPEVLKQTYNEKCDVWSIGVILYILLCGYPPFGGNTDREILQRVERGKFKFHEDEWCSVSEEAKDLITKMLTLNPDSRISAEECLTHPWIQQALKKEQAAVASNQLVNPLSNMRKFYASQKLAQAAMFFIGSKLTTIEETKELNQIFRSLDVNGDGQLDRNELILGYEQLLKFKDGAVGDMSREEIAKAVDLILESADFDKNGYVEYSEFVTVAMDKKNLLSKDRLRAAFDMFDQDKSGRVVSAELRSILRGTNDEQWNKIIAEVDVNNDGEVDFEEFVTMMQRYVPSEE